MHIEPATMEDLPQLADLLYDLFNQESDFVPDHAKQTRGLRLILEQPNRGRIFVMRHHDRIAGMINLLLTISTAEGGFVLLLEDLVVREEYRGQKVGTRLLEHAVEYARQKDFLRVTLLTDRVDEASLGFFTRRGFVISNMVPLRMYLTTPQQENGTQTSNSYSF